jgi:hypothetical protein
MVSPYPKLKALTLLLNSAVVVDQVPAFELII